jgi:FkbM family methyltransferase
LIRQTPFEGIARHTYHTLLVRTGRLPKRSAADLQNERYNQQSLAIMRRILKPDSNCIDVGCHEGTILRDILQLAPQGRHFAFEPLPEMHAALLQNLGAYDNVQFSNLALADKSGTAHFKHVVSNPGYSGFRQRHYDNEDEQVQTITVQTARLDDIVPKDCKIDFIKVDVEGAEGLVFRGALNTLARHHPHIIFEHGGPSLDYGCSPDDIYDLLVMECGLRLSLMEDWLNNGNTSVLSKTAFSDAFYKTGHFYYMAHP